MSNNDITVVPGWFYALCVCDPHFLNDEEIVRVKDGYNILGRECVFEFGKKNKILPYFAHSFLYCGCDAEYWGEIHEYYLNRSKRIIKLLDEVFVELNKSEIYDVCVCENFGSILSADACLGCFCSGDIDFYCKEKDIEKIDAIVTKFGFVWDDRHKKKKSFAREYKSINAIGEEFWLNFQWKPMTRKKTHLYDQRYIMRRFPKLFEETEVYKDTAIRIFKPEVALYLNCIHIASGHYYILMPKIRLYADIDRPIRSRKFDYEKFKSLALEDKLGLRTDAVLEISSILLKTPLEENVFIYSSVKRQKFINRFIDKETKELKLPKSNKFSRTKFLILTELLSDGKNIVSSFIQRLWVIVSSRD